MEAMRRCVAEVHAKATAAPAAAAAASSSAAAASPRGAAAAIKKKKSAAKPAAKSSTVSAAASPAPPAPRFFVAVDGNRLPKGILGDPRVADGACNTGEATSSSFLSSLLSGLSLAVCPICSLALTLPSSADARVFCVVPCGRLGTHSAEAIVKGDGKVFSIAAASILAKVTRDRLMRAHDAAWPEYGFKDHKG